MISGVWPPSAACCLQLVLGAATSHRAPICCSIAVAAALIGFAVLGAAKPNAFGTAMGAVRRHAAAGLTMMNAPYYTQDFIKGWCWSSPLSSPSRCRPGTAARRH
jgi:simple sugar transport system permease protein